MKAASAGPGKTTTVRVSAPAKINLFLEVTGKRPDGYHDLATLFARISLADSLTLTRSRLPGVRLRVKGGRFLSGPPEDNLVHRAAVSFFSAFRIPPAVDIELVKRIPIGAGLGGGSSDAASAISGLCRLYGVSMGRNRSRLEGMALALGSDVPFFLFGGSLSSGSGRGEILSPFEPGGRLPSIVLVYPGSPVPTGPVYRALRHIPAGEAAANLKKFRRLVKAIRSGSPLERWADLLYNRLEEPVLPAHPAVRRARAELAAAGAKAVLMSGSGASVFALAENRREAAKIAKIAKRPGNRVFLPDFC